MKIVEEEIKDWKGGKREGEEEEGGGEGRWKREVEEGEEEDKLFSSVGSEAVHHGAVTKTSSTF